MALVTLEDVHKSHDEHVLLRGASLVVEEDTRIGIVGANGCGKSTLLRLLAGAERPDTGRRTVRDGLRIGWLAQDVPIHAGTVRDAVRSGLEGRDAVIRRIDEIHHELSEPGLAPARTDALLAELARLESRRDHLGGHDIEHRVQAMIEHVGLEDPEASAANLSGGEQRRVALARILLDEPDLLLLDEPTNHLDAFVIDWLEDQLLTLRVPVVMVTHDRYFLDRIVDDVIEMDGGSLYRSTGGYSGYVAARAARETAAEHAEDVRRNLLRRETEWMRRGPPARTTKANARIERYHHLLDGAPPAPAGELAFRIPPGPRLGTRVLRTRDLTVRMGERTLVRSLDLDVTRGERLGIVGPNGAGKTTLLRVLTGARAPDGGTVEAGETVKLAGIDQLRADVDPESTVLEAIAADGDHVRVGGRPVRIEAFLEDFLFPGDRKHTQIRLLSGGERNRILLARLLLRGANVLILDEPTNDLDLPSLRALEEALLAFDGTVIAVSHDRWFLDRVATEILHLDGRGNARRWAGDLSSLLERIASERQAGEKREREAAARAAAAASAAAAESASRERATRPKKLGTREEKELADLPAKIEAAEARQHELTERLSDPALYASPGRAADRARIESDVRDTAAEIERLYARWTELEEKRTAGG